MVTDTAGPEPAANATPDAAPAMTIAPRRATRVLRCMRATPFHEGISAWWSEAGLLADGPTSRAFPMTRRHQWPFASGVPDHSGGCRPAFPAPASPPPPFLGG